MEGPPDTKLKPTPEAYADRIASERIGLAGTHLLHPSLAAELRALGVRVDPADVAGEGEDEN